MPRAGKLSLMIVEDDANIRFLLEAAARRSGLFHPIVAAADGEAAFSALHASDHANLPGLIVTDLSMPRMTGFELLRAVKSDPLLRAIPVAIITSSDAANDRELALAAGACAFVPKPYGIEALIRVFVALHEICSEMASATSHV